MTAMLSAIELTYSFHNIVEQYQVLDESLTGDSLLLYAAASAEDSTQYQFIKLCEDTSRRIANTKEPTTDAQVRALDGTVEGKLIREAMLDEVMSLIENGKVVPRHKSTVPNLYEIDGQWVIKFKKTLEGLLERVRSRWVLRGDKQRPYLDYDPNKIYSPVATKTATLSALALAAQYGMLLHVLDVSKAFTVSDIDMPGLHMKVPTCMEEYHPDYAPFGSETTWELLTSLYGLRQASSMYYDTFSKVILAYKDSEGKGYRRSDHDPCVFTKGKLGESDYITFSCHVDDAFIASAEYSSVEELMSVLTKAGFKFTIEPMNKVLGMQIQYTKYDKTVSGSGRVVIDHDMYITDSFDEMKSHFPPSTHSPLSVPMTDQAHKEREPEGEVEFDKARYKLFRTILGKLSHCSNFTHPEIAVAVSVVSQKMTNPSQRDLEKAFNILRYLLGTVGKRSAKLTLKHNPRFAQGGKSRQNPVHMCCDADLANCFETRRSRTGYCCFLFGMLVGWCSRRQPAVSLSTCESEYVAMSAAAQFGIWYKGLITDMGLELAYYEPIVILSDNKSAINISQSPVTVINKYSKHVQQKIHWFKEYIRNGTLRILFVPGDSNPADLFTKCLAKGKFIPYRDVVLHGDNRELRQISGLTCITRVLSLDAPRGISMDASECNCHNGSFFCFDTAQCKVLFHATESIER
jgi:hypothetical protein